MKPILFILVSLFALNSCVSIRSQTKRSPSGEFPSLYSEYLNFPPDANATCDEFFKLLNEKSPKPGTVFEALSTLKESKPKFFDYYTLFHTSHSLQKSSFSHPRAIVFGGDGKMVLTFNGDRRHDGYERLELMCFNEAESSFEFREITFPKEAKSVLEDLTVEQRSMPYVVSPINGSAARDCRQCHMSPARPNWDTYPLWPGAYGADNDAPFHKPYRESLENLKDSFDYQYVQAEAEAQKAYKQSGRYAVLGKLADIHPNSIAGKLFGILNAKRIVAELRRHGSAFERIKLDFAKALYCPIDNLEVRSFPNSDVSSGQSILMITLKSPLEKKLRGMVETSALYHFSKQNQMIDSVNLKKEAIIDPYDQSISEYFHSLGIPNSIAAFGGHISPDAMIRLARIEQVVKPLGINPRNWSMVLHGGLDFEDGTGGQAGSSFAQLLDEPFLRAFFPTDTALEQLVLKRRHASSRSEEEHLAKARELDKEVCDHLNNL